MNHNFLVPLREGNYPSKTPVGSIVYVINICPRDVHVTSEFINFWIYSYSTLALYICRPHPMGARLYVLMYLQLHARGALKHNIIDR